jgi:hypothetical protein
MGDNLQIPSFDTKLEAKHVVSPTARTHTGVAFEGMQIDGAETQSAGLPPNEYITYDLSINSSDAQQLCEAKHTLHPQSDIGTVVENVQVKDTEAQQSIPLLNEDEAERSLEAISFGNNFSVIHDPLVTLTRMVHQQQKRLSLLEECELLARRIMERVDSLYAPA